MAFRVHMDHEDRVCCIKAHEKIDSPSTIADPESFVRGGPNLTTFFFFFFFFFF